MPLLCNRRGKALCAGRLGRWKAGASTLPCAQGSLGGDGLGWFLLCGRRGKVLCAGWLGRWKAGEASTLPCAQGSLGGDGLG